MARLKITYIGGGSTRAPGTVASFIHQGENFQGSEIALVDLDVERLQIIKRMADKMIRLRGLDMTISITPNRRVGLADANAVLTSYRPGNFEARYLDESIPLKHGVVGQETQGPGGFFMALRSIHVMQGILADMERVCPQAHIFNYTNPINIISQSVTLHSSIPIISFCEGPLYYPRGVAEAAQLDASRLDTVMVGLNHGCWSVRHLYDGQDMMPLVHAAYERRRNDDTLHPWAKRMLALTAQMDSIPSDYFLYYYFRDEVFAEHLAKPTTRAQDIMAQVPAYWQHYREQADSDNPILDPARSRGGIHELELAIDAMDAVYNDRKEILPVNVPNNGVIRNLPDDLVVEVRGYVDRHGVQPIADAPLPRHVLGLVHLLGEYQMLTARAAWSGNRRDAIRALASNPLVLSLAKAQALYDEMAAAHKAYLPERLLS